MWWVKVPYLKSLPKVLNDLYVPIPDGRPASPSLAIYSFEFDAAVAARAALMAMKEQAERDLDFLSKPFKSPPGSGNKVTGEDIKKWQTEVMHVLRIAKCGLDILDAEPLPW